MKTPGILSKVGSVIDIEIKKVLKERGHSNTGALETSIQNKVNGIEVTGSMFDYGFIVNDGTKASRIPFRSGSGAKSSKYIDGLIAYFISKGFTEKEATGYAFGTAKKQKEEGMSTVASSKYSRTGKRQRFVEDSFDNKGNEIDKIMNEGMDVIFSGEYEKQKTETI